MGGGRTSPEPVQSRIWAAGSFRQRRPTREPEAPKEFPLTVRGGRKRRQVKELGRLSCPRGSAAARFPVRFAESWREPFVPESFTCAAVAPCAGAWIETCRSGGAIQRGDVASCAGAWIETAPVSALPMQTRVAPCAGAWIETSSWLWVRVGTSVAPIRERGLKLRRHTCWRAVRLVASSVGAWIETRATSRWTRRPTVAPCAGAWIETTRP